MVRMDLQRIIKPKVKPRTSQQKSKEENVYTVVVMANAAAVRNRLDAKTLELRVNEDCLSLHSITTKKQVVSWPYIYIRRYGPDADKFHVEAGRRCQTGEGLFSFKCYPGEAEIIHTSLKQIFNKIQTQKLSESSTTEHYTSSYRTSASPSRKTSTDSTSRETSLNDMSETAGDSSDEEENSPELPPRTYRTDTTSFKQMLGRIQETKQEKITRETKQEKTTDSIKSTKKVHFHLPQQTAHKSKPRSPDPKPPTKQRQLTPTEINDIIRQHRDNKFTSAIDTSNNNEDYSVLDQIRPRKVSDRTQIYDDIIYEE